MIDPELLDLLACPLCKVEVRPEEEEIVCTKCGRRYPVREDIPIMLLEEAWVPEETRKAEEAAGTTPEVF